MAREHKIPRLDSAVSSEVVNSEYKIKTPLKTPGEISLTSRDPVAVVRLNCQSLITYSPDTIVKCNSCVKTIFTGGSGDQTEIIECGKCRTSYLVRTQFDDKGQPIVDCAIWDISRNVKNYGFVKTNDAGDFIIKFNNEKSPRPPRVK